MPAAATLIIQGIFAALQAAPQVEALYAKAKEFFTTMFQAGLITKEVQDALHARVDADLALFKTGALPPPEFQVQPDPQ